MPYIGSGIQRFNTADGLTVNGNAEVTGTTALTGNATAAGTLDVTGAITSSAGATITTADNSPQLILKSTDADADTGPEIELFRDSASPAADDGLGQIQFKGRNTAAEELIYGEIDTAIIDPTDGSEDSEMRLLVKRNGAGRAALILDSTKAVFNEAGIDADFRVESDNQPSMFFVDAGNDRIGINNASPSYLIDALGTGTGDNADTIVRVKAQGTGDSDVNLILDSADTGESLLSFYNQGNNEASIEWSNPSSELNIRTASGTNGTIDMQPNNLLSARFTNRSAAQGDIIQFMEQDGSSIAGSIGTRSATNLFVAFRTEANGDGCGLSGSASSAGAILPTDGDGTLNDNHIDIGGGSNRFDDIFATNGTIQTSDQNEKQQIASLTTAEMTAAKAISKLFKTFKWNDKVEAKGDAARIHAGVIAQEVQTAMTDAGLDAADYAFWCSNTWWEADGETYDTADEAPEGATQRTRLAIRYAELMAFVGAATEQRLADIETRLTALEDA